MVNIIERDGIITLDGQFFDLKIDNNRLIYIKNKKDTQFKSIGEEVEQGLSSVEKKQFLYELYTKILQKLQDRQGIPPHKRAELNTEQQSEPPSQDNQQKMDEPKNINKEQVNERLKR